MILKKGIVTFSMVLIFFISMCVYIGCSKPPPPPPQPQEPPPPSPEQIQSELMASLQPLMTALSQGTGLSPDQHESIVNNLRTVKSKYSAIENGRIAVSRVATQLEGTIKEARDKKRWGLVKTAIRAYDVLRPGALGPDGKYNRLMEMAELMISRPRVDVNGFLESEGDLYVFLTVTDTKTNKKESFKVREGEEFYEPMDENTKTKKPPILKVVRVIGDQQSVELLYIPANDTWVVPGPRNKG